MDTNRPTPSDILAALIYLIDRKLLRADPIDLHRAFYDVRDLSPLLARFGFSVTGVTPMSRLLDESLASLKLSRIVRMENTDYERYIIDKGSRNFIETRILPRFTTEEIEALRSAAAVLREKCGASETPAEA